MLGLFLGLGRLLVNSLLLCCRRTTSGPSFSCLYCTGLFHDNARYC